MIIALRLKIKNLKKYFFKNRDYLITHLTK